jgi:DNA-binding IclR family transcriptional regulator
LRIAAPFGASVAPGPKTDRLERNRGGGMAADDTPSRLVPALERGVRILDFVARSRSTPTLTEIARELSIAKSSAHTLCNTLTELELLIRRPDQTYRIGPYVMRWANAFVQQSDVAAEFATLWDEETELPGATITLTVLEDGEVVYIAARNSAVSHSLIEFRAGMRLPACFTATGKAFLSCMSEFEVRRLYREGLPAPMTPHSVRDVDALLAELAAVRQNGFSLDNQQVAEGIICFGASVFDSRNRPIAGVAVSLPADRLGEMAEEKVISNVQRIAARLSHRMGADRVWHHPTDPAVLS